MMFKEFSEVVSDEELFERIEDDGEDAIEDNVAPYSEAVIKGGGYGFKTISILMKNFISSLPNGYVEAYGFLVENNGVYYVVPHPIVGYEGGYPISFSRDLYPYIKRLLYRYVRIHGRFISKLGKRLRGLVFRRERVIHVRDIDKADPPVISVLSTSDYMNIMLDGIELYGVYRGVDELYPVWFAGSPRLIATGGYIQVL